MRSVIAIVLCAAAVYASSSSSSTSSYSSPEGGFFVWQGFDYEWMNKEFGFETPHRMGSIASYLTTTSFDSDGGDGVFEYTFTPGVNGDYAYPTVFYAAQSTSGGVYSDRSDFRATWTDSVTGPSDNPVASHNAQYNVSIDLNTAALAYGSLDTYDAVFDGFNLTLWCNPDLQPSGHSCNSNGMWASTWIHDLSECSVVGSSLECTLDVNITRSWSAHEGGGKPLNYIMSFDVTWMFTVVGGNAGNLSVTQSDLTSTESTIYTGPLTLTQTLSGEKGYDHGVVGLKGFGYQLTETNGQIRLGRYMEQLIVTAGNSSYDSSTGTATYKTTRGFLAPKTTETSNVVYYMRTALLAMSEAAYSPTASATGVVCENDGIAFHCDNHGLPQQLSGSEKVSTKWSDSEGAVGVNDNKAQTPMQIN